MYTPIGYSFPRAAKIKLHENESVAIADSNAQFFQTSFTGSIKSERMSKSDSNLVDFV